MNSVQATHYSCDFFPQEKYPSESHPHSVVSLDSYLYLGTVLELCRLHVAQQSVCVSPGGSRLPHSEAVLPHTGLRPLAPAVLTGLERQV